MYPYLSQPGNLKRDFSSHAGNYSTLRLNQEVKRAPEVRKAVICMENGIAKLGGADDYAYKALKIGAPHTN